MEGNKFFSWIRIRIQREKLQKKTLKNCNHCNFIKIAKTNLIKNGSGNPFVRVDGGEPQQTLHDVFLFTKF